MAMHLTRGSIISRHLPGVSSSVLPINPSWISSILQSSSIHDVKAAGMGIPQWARSITSTTPTHRMNIENLSHKILQMEYAVRGRIASRAEEHMDALKRGEKRPFKNVIMCNIGNPHAVGQPHLTYARQVLALVSCPWILRNPVLAKEFPSDTVERAKELLENSHGIGAYSTSKGILEIRKQVAEFMKERDGYEADYNNIFLTNGASDGVKTIMSMLIRDHADHNDGVLVPVPQYPLYSASMTFLGGDMISYYLDEVNGWELNLEEMRRSNKQARERGVLPRALVVINPGNPTGQVISEKNMREVVTFCEQEDLLLMADEVYQENVYNPNKKFVSFKKVMRDLNANIELVSFHSTSKGILGECGLRGGYMELVNIDPEVVDQVYKSVSVNLCANIPGQIMTSVLVNPPKPGEPSYPLFKREYDDIFSSLSRKAAKLSEALNKLPKVKCNISEGAMYAFPRIELPSKAVGAAKKLGMTADTMYCLQLLDETGISTVPGSGFFAPDHPQIDSFHFRTTILPPEDEMDYVIDKLTQFHLKFLKTYS